MHTHTMARRAGLAPMVSAVGTACCALVAALAATPAQAQLQPRSGGLYDATLGITWLAAADAAAGSSFDDGVSASDGLLSWASAQAWAASLRVGGAAGWRLPTVDTACNGGGGLGYGCASAAGELGHLFHATLGGRAGVALSASHGPAYALVSGLADQSFWAADTYANDPDQAGVLMFGDGWQDFAFKQFSEHAAWAVHTGDVLAAVPEPASMLLMLGGLAGLAGLAGRGRSAAAAAGSGR